MSKQILTRAFYGWLTYHRNLKTVNIHLTGLVNQQSLTESSSNIEIPPDSIKCFSELLQLDLNDEHQSLRCYEACLDFYLQKGKKLDQFLWDNIFETSNQRASVVTKLRSRFHAIVYRNGLEHSIRKRVT